MTTYKCSKCEYEAGTKGNANLHINNVEKCKGASIIENIVTVECDVCNKLFDTKFLLSKHKKRCVVKKAMIYEKLIDPNEIKESMIEIMKIVSGLMIENKELSRRIEKLESVNKVVIEEEGEEEGGMCEYNKVVKFIPTSREQIKTIFREHEYEDYKNIVVTLNGQRNLEINALVTKEGIEVDKNMYYYNASKKEKSSSDLKVIIKKYCQNSVKVGHVYCKEHT
jgi:hypothetical protein